MSIPNSFSDETIEKLASPEALFAKSLEIKSGAQVHHPQADTFHAAAVRIERLLEENAALKAAAAPAVEVPEFGEAVEPAVEVPEFGEVVEKSHARKKDH